MAVPSAASVDRLSLLAPFHSKVGEDDLEALAEKYDIPEAFRLAVPGKDDAVFNHSGEWAPLYLAHMDYGLRLPIPPFVRRVCERVGVSPMQFAPNAIAILMAFLVICHRVGVKPTLQLFSNLVSIKASKKDAHFFFMNQGEKLVNFPESNKRWKEKFVWVFGADPILICRTWPEIDKEALKALPLSVEERQDLERIRSYDGSRDVHNLFDASSLRAAGLSHLPANEADEERAAALAAVGSTLHKDPKGKEQVKPTDSKLPLKRSRTGLSAKEIARLAATADKAAGMLTSPGAIEEPKKKKKKKGEKVLPAPEGGMAAATAEPRASPSIEADTPAVTPAVIDLDAPEPGEVPVTESASRPGSPSRAAEDVAPVVGDRAIARQSASVASEAVQGLVEGAAPILRGEVATESPALGASGLVGSQRIVEGPAPKSPQGPAPLIVGGSSSSRGGADEATPIEERPLVGLPFCHKFSELGRSRWEKRRAQLIGELDEWFSQVDDPPEADRFIPNFSLRKDDSVLLSGRAQLTAFDQFLLPRDIEMLAEIPTGGLRVSLLSYCIRGALIGEELHDRINQALQASGKLAAELSEEKKTREGLEKRVNALEAEKARADALRAREMEMKQLAITNLEVHKSKQAATIVKLKEEIVGLKSTVERSQAVSTQQEERIKLLEENIRIETLARQAASAEAISAQRALGDMEMELTGVKASMEDEARARQAAQAELLSTQRALEGVKVELEGAKVARDSALADVKSIEGRLDYMTSEDGKKEVINEYRQSPVGKAEVLLAIKAGFDFLRKRLPLPMSESVTVQYPPRVQGCVELLEDLEARGGGLSLHSDEEEDDDEDSSDEDGDDDEDGDPK